METDEWNETPHDRLRCCCLSLYVTSVSRRCHYVLRVFDELEFSIIMLAVLYAGRKCQRLDALDMDEIEKIAEQWHCCTTLMDVLVILLWNWVKPLRNCTLSINMQSVFVYMHYEPANFCLEQFGMRADVSIAYKTQFHSFRSYLDLDGMLFDRSVGIWKQ